MAGLLRAYASSAALPSHVEEDTPPQQFWQLLLNGLYSRHTADRDIVLCAIRRRVRAEIQRELGQEGGVFAVHGGVALKALLRAMAAVMASRQSRLVVESGAGSHN